MRRGFPVTGLVSIISSTVSSLIISGLDASTCIIPISIKYFIALMNSESGILSSAHHPAVFLTQSGMILSGPEGPGSVWGM